MTRQIQFYNGEEFVGFGTITVEDESSPDPQFVIVKDYAVYYLYEHTENRMYKRIDNVPAISLQT